MKQWNNENEKTKRRDGEECEPVYTKGLTQTLLILMNSALLLLIIHEFRKWKEEEIQATINKIRDIREDVNSTPTSTPK